MSVSYYSRFYFGIKLNLEDLVVKTIFEEKTCKNGHVQYDNKKYCGDCGNIFKENIIQKPSELYLKIAKLNKWDLEELNYNIKLYGIMYPFNESGKHLKCNSSECDSECPHEKNIYTIENICSGLSVKELEYTIKKCEKVVKELGLDPDDIRLYSQQYVSY